MNREAVQNTFFSSHTVCPGSSDSFYIVMYYIKFGNLVQFNTKYTVCPKILYKMGNYFLDT